MELTPKDIRVIEIQRKHTTGSLVDSLAEYHFLVDTLFYLHEAIAEEQVPIKYWQKDAEILFYKFAIHGLTLHQIFNGRRLSSVYYKEEVRGKTSIDISSARTILRAQFEAFLMYHHIYVNPIDDDLKELRYNAWIYSSVLQRQKFPSKTAFSKQQKAKDAIELNKIKETISKLKSFQNLSTKQQQSLFQIGSGKLFNHWAAILKETGFSESTPFYTIYTLLCMYAHSEGISIIQLRYHPGIQNTVRTQANLDLFNAKLLICLMISSLTKLYEVVNRKYDTLPEQVKIDIETYCMMAIKDKT